MSWKHSLPWIIIGTQRNMGEMETQQTESVINSGSDRRRAKSNGRCDARAPHGVPGAFERSEKAAVGWRVVAAIFRPTHNRTGRWDR